jgi:hypothetical protein
MEHFTFNDFVHFCGQSNTSDPSEVLEAWERFCAARDDLESPIEEYSYE